MSLGRPLLIPAQPQKCSGEAVAVAAPTIQADPKGRRFFAAKWVSNNVQEGHSEGVH